MIQNSNLPIATILSSNGYPGLSISAVSTTVTAASPSTSSKSFAGDHNSKLSFGGIIGVVVGVVLGSILTAGGQIV